MASFSWSWCFLEDIRMAHFFEPLSIWDHLCYFHTWMTSWLAQRSVLKLLIETFNGGESDLLTVLPAIHSCAGLDDREIWFKRVFSVQPHPLQSQWKFLPILARGALPSLMASDLTSSHISGYLHRYSSGRFREGLLRKPWDLPSH